LFPTATFSSSTGSSSTTTTTTTSTTTTAAAETETRVTPEPLKGPKPSHGVDSQIGRRPTMEDTHTCVEDMNKEFPDIPKGVSYYAVYDGHGGRETAEIVSENLYKKFAQKLVEKKFDYEAALKESFAEMDQEVLKESKQGMWNSGATAVIVVLAGDILWVANLGDAEAVLPQLSEGKTEGKNISILHRPTTPSERQRIEQAGGHVMFGRVLGTLAVSRAFGDIEFKHPHNRFFGSNNHFVSPEPHVTSVKLTKDTPFIIVACDGLWEKLDYAGAVKYCLEKRREGKTPEDTAKELVKYAIDQGSTDNVTCIIVYLNWD